MLFRLLRGISSERSEIESLLDALYGDHHRKLLASFNFSICKYRET